MAEGIRSEQFQYYPFHAAVKALPVALVVSKAEQRWHPLFKEKFSGYYNLQTFYIRDYVSQHGYSACVRWLNSYIEETGAHLVFLDVEFCFGFGLDLILCITRDVKIVLTTFDDISFHEINYINALGCDLVICADPIAVLKYREKGINAWLFFLENSRETFDRVRGTKKDIDVLFYGSLLKGARTDFLEKLGACGIGVTVHSPGVDGELPYCELVQLISRAKIVLNLSKTHTMKGRLESFVPVRHYMAFKGRVIEAGLASAACVSEYAPSIEYMFGNDTVPMFHSVEECADIIQRLLGDPARIEELSARLRAKVLARYEQVGQVAGLVTAVEDLRPVEKVPPQWIPYRYVAAVVSARLTSVRRPVKVWFLDLWSLLFRADVYGVHLRLWAVLTEVIPRMGKWLTKQAENQWSMSRKKRLP